MSEIVIYITILGAESPMCENPVIAQNVADHFNGPNAHCVKGEEPGQWVIEEPTHVSRHGIGMPLDIDDDEGNSTRTCVEDAYCFYGRDMPVKLMDMLPKEVKLAAQES